MMCVSFRFPTHLTSHPAEIASLDGVFNSLVRLALFRVLLVPLGVVAGFLA